ncbi:hypothetical protein BDV95DRAFT_280527 [Massariosphaeria phaeospora]|uniref:F-box domain-containing protein n=1 Tax=Massariosphaeria phaeospora TaxID=100035 RepID=A0A7C8IGE5_9PLEO|nr:hypothetical protein BDV95DRAFT_280527 [Massariosphaeria phaeospora]
MASLTTLPTELLVAIAEYLDGKTAILNSLSQVCRRLRPIAQDLMYTNITLRGHRKGELACLLRTLLGLPCWLEKIRRLDLELTHLESDTMPKQEFLPFESASTQEAFVGNIINQLSLRSRTDDASSLETFTSRWADGLKANGQAKFAGVLLALVPKAVDIRLTMLDSEGNSSPSYNPCYAFFNIGREVTHILGGLSSFFSGLRNVKRITIPRGNISILHLPFLGLETLEVHLGRITLNHTILDNLPAYAQLQTMILRGDSKHLMQGYADGWVNQAIRQFQCLGLSHFEFHLRNPRPLYEYAPASFSPLVQSLHSVASTLKSLKLDFSIDEQTFGSGDHAPLPVCSFEGLPNLQQLEVPMFALPVDPQLNAPMATLEKLTIICPTAGTLDYLERLTVRTPFYTSLVLSYTSLVPSLQEVVLLCRSSKGEPMSYFHDNNHHVFRKLRGMGVSVSLRECDAQDIFGE